MPWEKAFDTDKVLERAAEVFSIKGYEATSIADLLRAMEINKGSLYNSFGSKRDLFRAVLTKFVEHQQAEVLQRLSALNDPIVALITPFDVIMAHTAKGQQLKGGLVVTVALDFPNHDEAIQALVRGAIGGLEGFFLSKIAEGQRSGVIDASIDAQVAAKSLIALTVGFRVLSRGTFDVEALKAVKGSALRLVGISGTAQM